MPRALIAEFKRHGLGRARCRSTGLVHLQLLAAATVINLKRLVAAHAGHEAKDSVAAAGT